MSSIIGFILIALAITLLMFLGEFLHWLFAPRTPKKVRLSHALDDLFLQSGYPRYSVTHIERLVFIHFLWIMIGSALLLGADFNWDLSFGTLPFTALFALGLGIWWAWRRGILR